MLGRFSRLFSSILHAGSLAAPIKALAGLVVTMIVPYLLYAFLGGFGLALALVGIIWGIWYLAKKK